MRSAALVGAAALAASSLSVGTAAAAFSVDDGRARSSRSPPARIRAAAAASRPPSPPPPPPSSSSLPGGALRYSSGEDAGMTEEEELSFLSRARDLCDARNLPLERVKNARDLASVPGSPVRPGRIYRTGRVSDASDADVALLFDELGVRTLVDLRSPTELKDDPTLEREAVFKDFVSVVWRERGRERDGRVRELRPGQPRIRSRAGGDEENKKGRRTTKEHVRELLDGVRTGAYAATHDVADEEEERKEKVLNGGGGGDDDDDEDESFEREQGGEDGADDRPSPPSDRRERHFVSIMNEFKYVRGTLSKLRKRDIARAILRSPAGIVSRRARARVKDVFLDEINGGGLPMLNELLLRFGAPGIRRVLELCSDRSRHPVAFYCTAGKDRTGMIAALLLSALGVPDEDVVEDYSLSANVYAEMNDHKAMVGALSQRNLDPKTFLGAPPQVMWDTLASIRENYGSVEGYLDWIGFDEESREKLRDALLSP